MIICGALRLIKACFSRHENPVQSRFGRLSSGLLGLFVRGVLPVRVFVPVMSILCLLGNTEARNDCSKRRPNHVVKQITSWTAQGFLCGKRSLDLEKYVFNVFVTCAMPTSVMKTFGKLKLIFKNVAY